MPYAAQSNCTKYKYLSGVGVSRLPLAVTSSRIPGIQRLVTVVGSCSGAWKCCDPKGVSNIRDRTLHRRAASMY